MKNHLKQIPYYVLLLPFFFIFHGFVENFGFLSLKDALKLFITYTFLTTFLFLLSWLFFRDLKKSALMTGSWMALYLFFGALFDFLKDHSPVRFLWKYSFLAPAFLLLLLLLFIYLLKKKPRLNRLTFFLNVLFITYIAIDALNGSWMAIHPHQNRLSYYDFSKQPVRSIPDTCKKPDIYFLLFDEYASSLSLKQHFNFDNDIDSFLRNKHFSIQARSKSNYTYTPFSMASTLNMSYLGWLNADKGVSRNDFLKCNTAIKENELIKFFTRNNYEVVNLSFFDLADHPALLNQSLIPVKTKMITEGTLFSRIYIDFKWIFLKNKFISHLMEAEYVWFQVKNNDSILAEVVNQSRMKLTRPRFIYAHIFLPHYPYYFDSSGTKRDNALLAANPYIDPLPYLGYVRYTNSRIKTLITQLMINTDSQAAIILLGDHGFRQLPVELKPDWHFQNLNAVYFPNRDYHLLYDSISNVNEFRVVLNALFGQQIPMLKDSTIYLVDKK